MTDYTFSFNNINSNTLGLKLKKLPDDVMPKRKTASTNLNKQNGKTYRDFGTYEAYSLTIECVLIETFSPSHIRQIKNVLANPEGKLVLGWKPGLTYQAMLTASTSFKEIAQGCASFTLTFEVQPYAAMASASEPVIIKSGTSLINPGKVAEPVLTLELSGPASLFINQQEMKFFDYDSVVVVDCEEEDLRGENGENLNRLLSLESDFAVLEEGENLITYTSGIKSCSIVPNWRDF